MTRVMVLFSLNATGAGEVSNASAQLSEGATKQASSLQEITASMSEIGSQTNQNAENAVQANQLSISASENATVGNSEMKKMLTANGRYSKNRQHRFHCFGRW